MMSATATTKVKPKPTKSITGKTKRERLGKNNPSNSVDVGNNKIDKHFHEERHVSHTTMIKLILQTEKDLVIALISIGILRRKIIDQPLKIIMISRKTNSLLMRMRMTMIMTSILMTIRLLNELRINILSEAAAADNDNDSSDDEVVVGQAMNQYQHHYVDDENNGYDSSDDEAVERVMNQRTKKRMMTTTTSMKK
jgi:hypothetical protein